MKRNFEESIFILKKFVQNSPCAVALLDKKLNFLSASLCWQQIVLKDKNDYIEKNLDHYFPNRSENFQFCIEAALLGKSQKIKAEQITRSDGHKQWLQWDIHPWYYINEEIAGVIIYMELVSELEHKSDMINNVIQILNSTQIAVIVFDTNKKIAYINDHTKTLFGYTKEELIGKTFDVLLENNSITENEKILSELIYNSNQKVSTRNSVIVNCKKKDNKIVPIDISIGSSVTREGIIMTAFLKDITLTKTLEEQLNLAIKLREDVLAIVSHDLKNSLSIISFSSHILKEKLNMELEQKMEYFGMISRSVEQMSKLITDLLDFTKFQSGNIKLDFKSENISELLQSLFENYKIQSQFKNQKIFLNLPSETLYAVCDINRIEQVFNNLVYNAIKFTPIEGTIELMLFEKNKNLIFSVSDTGIGIKKENLEKVFDRYWRVNEKNQLGSGLGLAIVKSIVEAHNGKTWVESEINKGCKFYFTIPEQKIGSTI